MTLVLILFFNFFPFDSLGAVPENPGTIIRSVRLYVGPICRGTSVKKHKGVWFSEPENY